MPHPLAEAPEPPPFSTTDIPQTLDESRYEVHHDHFSLCPARLDRTRHPQLLSNNTDPDPNADAAADADNRPTDHPAVLDNRLVLADIALGYTRRVGYAR